MSKLEVKNVLEIDQKARRLDLTGTSKDLWSLEQIEFDKDWDYSLPTIHSHSTVDLRNRLIKNMDHFNGIFTKKYADYFSKVKFDNILIAGGAITSLLLQYNWENDVDIFIYGLNEEEANKRVETLIKEIYASYREKLSADLINKHKKEKKDPPTKEEIAYVWAKEAEIINIRNQHCISLQLGGYDSSHKVQIILRLYKSISEILHGFDMGSSAMGFDGQKVYFTSLGKFAYEYLANIVDTSRRSTTYEKRLMKYHGRGFQIILPYLNISQLRTKYHQYGLVEVCDLPYFVFSYKSIQGNKIYMDELLEWGTAVVKPEEEKPDSDYQPTEIDEYKVFYLNLKTLVGNSQNFYYYSERMNFDILKDPPYISSSRIIDFYDSIGKRIYDKSNFNAKIFSTYFPSDLLPTLANKLFNEKDYKFLTKVIQKQKQVVLERYEKIRKLDHSKLSWITKNPGTQLTSSFNPIIADPEDWYGQYYRPNPFGSIPVSVKTKKPVIMKKKLAQSPQIKRFKPPKTLKPSDNDQDEENEK